MKTLSKIIAVAMIVTVGAYQINAQGLYINAGVGYGMAAGKSQVGSNITVATATTEEGVYDSYGKGLNFGLGIGYMFNENIGAELGISYLMGSTIDESITAPNFSGSTETKGKMIRLMPAVKITTGDDMKPYAKFGLVLGMGSKLEYDFSGSGDVGFGSGSVSETGEHSGGTSFGWMGAVGVEFPAGDKLSVYVELNNINLTWAPDEYEYTYTDNFGGSTTTETKTIKFEDTDPDTDNSDVQLKEYSPFGSFGIGAGIKYTLGD